jgi:RNA polymerase sigma factor (sigma-70 family)
VEASAFPAPSGLARTRISIGAPLLRLRSDEQLVALFRDGSNEAFRVIYDRYRQRLFAYTRQMLPGSRQDAEDALQDVFVRAYGGLRANDRELALRAWLYRVAHNRCIDELRRPAPPAPEVMELVRPPLNDPIAEAERRDSLRRLIADVRRLPEQQRSALLMRELGGMSYAEIAAALAVSIAAVKSLLVRARVGLAQAAEARETSCTQIREDLIGSHDRGVKASGMARRHMRDCAGCREFRGRLRGTSRQFAALTPAIGPVGLLAKLLGFGGGAGGGAAAGGGVAAAGGAAGTTGTLASVGVLASGATHVATILAAAAVVTAGGAVGIQHALAPSAHHSHHRAPPALRSAPPSSAVTYSDPSSSGPVVVAERPPAQGAPQAPAPPVDATAPSHQISSTSVLVPAVTDTSPSGPTDATPANATGGAGTGASADPGTGTKGSATGTLPVVFGPTGPGAATGPGSASGGSGSTTSSGTGTTGTTTGSSGGGSSGGSTGSGTGGSGTGSTTSGGTTGSGGTTAS